MQWQIQNKIKGVLQPKSFLVLTINLINYGRNLSFQFISIILKDQRDYKNCSAAYGVKIFSPSKRLQRVKLNLYAKFYSILPSLYCKKRMLKFFTFINCKIKRLELTVVLYLAYKSHSIDYNRQIEQKTVTFQSGSLPENCPFLFSR